MTDPDSPHPSPEAKAGVQPHVDAVRDALSEIEAHTAEMSRTLTGDGTLTDSLAGWLSAQMLVTAMQMAREAKTSCLPLGTLNALCQNIVALRAGDHRAARLRIESERLELERARSEKSLAEVVERRLASPEIRERMFGPKLSPEARDRRVREILGLPPRREDSSEDQPYPPAASRSDHSSAAEPTKSPENEDEPSLPA